MRHSLTTGQGPVFTGSPRRVPSNFSGSFRTIAALRPFKYFEHSVVLTSAD